MQRRTCYFSGHVQGVGFRYTARDIAARSELTGFVRNLPDGRVELVVEGAAQEIDRFVEAIRRSMGQFIRRVDSETDQATGEFDGFEIRF